MPTTVADPEQLVTVAVAAPAPMKSGTFTLS